MTTKMTHPRLIKRVVTCQGTIQLVTALSVLSYREKEQKRLGYEYENYLVVYDLLAPPEQINDFVALIRKMAERVCNWKQIVHITPEQLADIKQKLNCTGKSQIYQKLFQIIGVNTIDEIYLCRNWQFGNQLLINAYQGAEKICYGDSIGIYFSQNSTAFFALKESLDNQVTISHILNQVKSQIRNTQAFFNYRTILKEINFDIGYFTLPNIMGEAPPMKNITLDKYPLIETFNKITGFIDLEYLNFLQDIIGTSPIFILLTSNFSEAGRMSVENEIAAYRKMLESDDIKPNTILIVKPHPRDDYLKIQQLKLVLSDLFQDIILLTSTELFFLPFEIFFMEVIHKNEKLNLSNIKIFSVSSACLSLSLLFNVMSFIGFGKEVTEQSFYPSYLEGRLKHEKDLVEAIHAINTNYI